MIGFAWRLLGRELRSGELRTLLAALVVAVAAEISLKRTEGASAVSWGVSKTSKDASKNASALLAPLW